MENFIQFIYLICPWLKGCFGNSNRYQLMVSINIADVKEYFGNFYLIAISKHKSNFFIS